jgi:hypothetical protein
VHALTAACARHSAEHATLWKGARVTSGSGSKRNLDSATRSGRRSGDAVGDVERRHHGGFGRRTKGQP